MDDTRNNVVDILGSLVNSPVTVNQNQDGSQSVHDKHIEYVIDENTVRIFSQKPAEKMYALFVGTLAVSGLGLLADMAGLLSYIGIQKGLVLLFLTPLCLLMALLTKHDRWLTSLNENGTAYFREGLWAYAVMSNHYHLVVRVDAQRVAQWSDDEVLRRWTSLFTGPLPVRQYLERGGQDLSRGVYQAVALWAATYRERLSDASSPISDIRRN